MSLHAERDVAAIKAGALVLCPKRPTFPRLHPDSLDKPRAIQGTMFSDPDEEEQSA